jgi:hypothetical protein
MQIVFTDLFLNLLARFNIIKIPTVPAVGRLRRLGL